MSKFQTVLVPRTTGNRGLSWIYALTNPACDWMRLQSFVLLIVGVLLVALSGCATGPALTNHSFSFDFFTDSPDAELLDYRYGSSKQPGAHANEYSVQKGHIGQQWNMSGAMLRGDFLYAKWRIKNTGKEYEDTVDLRSRLPANITGQTIHFAVKGPQLYVYLISPERRPPDWPPNGPRMFDYLKVLTIYPDQSGNK